MQNEELKHIPLNLIDTDDNYRKTFNENSLKGLAASIKTNGVLEPILVRPRDGRYQLIAGERRVRASLLVGLVTIPAMIRDVDDEQFLKMQLVENIQRENVHFMEEAYGIQRLREQCDLNMDELKKIIGKSEGAIYNYILLTRMSPEVQEIAKNRQLGTAVAIQIARLPNFEMQNIAARALARKQKDKWVSDRFARKYLEETFGSNRVRQPKKTAVQKSNGNDYAANWKTYLVRFTNDQFAEFRTIVKGRTDTRILAEAVEVVMLAQNEQLEVSA